MEYLVGIPLHNARIKRNLQIFTQGEAKVSATCNTILKKIGENGRQKPKLLHKLDFSNLKKEISKMNMLRKKESENSI